jgi:hypothetical protein
VRRTRPEAAPSRVPLVTRRAPVCARARASVCIECSSRGAGEYRIRVLRSYRNPSLCSILACRSVSNARVVAPGRVCGLRCDSFLALVRARACLQCLHASVRVSKPGVAALSMRCVLGSLVTAPSAPSSRLPKTRFTFPSQYLRQAYARRKRLLTSLGRCNLSESSFPFHCGCRLPSSRPLTSSKPRCRRLHRRRHCRPRPQRWHRRRCLRRLPQRRLCRRYTPSRR